MKQRTLPRRVVQEAEAELVEDTEEEHLMFMLEFGKSSSRTEDEVCVGSILQIAVDTGSEVHANPYKMMRQFVSEMSETSLLLRGA